MKGVWRRGACEKTAVVSIGEGGRLLFTAAAAEKHKGKTAKRERNCERNIAHVPPPLHAFVPSTSVPVGASLIILPRNSLSPKVARKGFDCPIRMSVSARRRLHARYLLERTILSVRESKGQFVKVHFILCPMQSQFVIAMNKVLNASIA